MSLLTGSTDSTNLFGTDENYAKYQQLQALKRQYKKGEITIPSLSGSSDDSESAATASLGKLYESCQVLNKRGADSLFRRTDDATKKEAKTAVTSFVSAYNDMVKNGVSDENTAVARNTAYMVSQTKQNASALSTVGISIAENGLLSLDETKFAAADLSALREVFVGNSSYISQTQKSLLQISLAASGTATDTTSTYGNQGSFGESSGSTFSASR